MTPFLYTIAIAIFIYVLLNLRTLLNRHPHPLPPGPKPWPIIGNLPHLGPVPHHSLAALAQKYGPLMHLRLGSVHVVVAASASVAAQFLKVHDANFSSRPPNSGAKHMAYNYQDLVFAPYGPRWRMLRKICNEETSILTRALANAGKSTVNLGQLLSVCTTNALGRVILGRRVFGDGTGGGDPKADEFRQMVVEQMVLAGLFNVGDFVPALDWLDFQGVASKMKKLHARFDSFLNEIVDDHKMKASDAKHMDLLSTLLAQKDNIDGEGGKLSDIEIKALLLDLFTAGTDTSSNTVEWAIAELIRHPKILAQVQQELDSVIGPNRLAAESDLPQLTYLQAVIKETFRLHPATPFIPRKAAEGCEINGYHMEKGATLLVNVWAIARDPKQWAEPLKFRPNRFLPGGEKPSVDVKGNDFEVIPFGAGRRICAGMNLGLRMVTLLTATLVHAFNWELPEGQHAEKLNMEEAYGLTLQRAAPLMVHPKPRLAPQTYGTLS
ncbi:Cytochrome P450 [Dillenia turbinata]|uniref:Cytochrome P450 n=1 Tax=Dillenia turbinata TaxID=194707 RepID=A0AAN8YZK6_9MAGN